MADETNGAAPAAEKTESPSSMYAEMAAVFDKMQEPEASPDASVPSAEGTPPPEQSATASSQPRGPDGKFIPAPKAAPDAPITDPGKTATAEPGSPAIEPPQSWSADLRPKWATLAPDVQKYVLQREAEIQKGFEQNAAKLKEYEPLNAVLEPIRQRLAFQGVSPHQYIQQMMAADEMLRTQPAQALQMIAQMYGLDLPKLMQPPEQAPPVDPTVAALQKQLQTITASLESEKRAQTMAQVEAFKANPKHPHFEDVRQHMAALMQAGQAKDMQDAYDQAVWANPTVRAQLLAEQQAEADRKRQDEAKKKAAEAQRIAGTNISARGAVHGSPATPKTMRQTMEEVADRHFAS